MTVYPHDPGTVGIAPPRAPPGAKGSRGNVERPRGGGRGVGSPVRHNQSFSVEQKEHHNFLACIFNKMLYRKCPALMATELVRSMRAPGVHAGKAGDHLRVEVMLTVPPRCEHVNYGGFEGIIPPRDDAGCKGAQGDPADVAPGAEHRLAPLNDAPRRCAFDGEKNISA